MARLDSALVVALAVVWLLPRALAVRVGDDDQPFHDNASNAKPASDEVKPPAANSTVERWQQPVTSSWRGVSINTDYVHAVFFGVVFLSCVLNLSMSLNSVGKAKSRAQTTMYRRYWKRASTKPEGSLLHSLGRFGHLFS
eukprot:TRINITY_DN10983_c0_g1_i1.p1 TRINITY_DN10983_c0_g1~~TRINITY_DN10983_c0_g1_i1.p1  ORF type:complete len:140 (-),score=20.25 TRINITY_DN10983_c0_g1_i1:131-550(-)